MTQLLNFGVEKVGCRLINTLKGHSKKVYSVGWSFDGKNLGLLKRHSDKVRSVAWSCDSKMLVSASSDRLALLWNLELLNFDFLLDRGCNRARDYLTTHPHVSNSHRHLCDEAT